MSVRNIAQAKVAQSKSKGEEYKKELYDALSPEGLSKIKGNEDTDDDGDE